MHHHHKTYKIFPARLFLVCTLVQVRMSGVCVCIYDETDGVAYIDIQAFLSD